MSAVADGVDVIAASSIEATGGTALKVDMVDVDAAVNDIGEGICASSVIVAVGG